MFTFSSSSAMAKKDTRHLRFWPETRDRKKWEFFSPRGLFKNNDFQLLLSRSWTTPSETWRQSSMSSSLSAMATFSLWLSFRTWKSLKVISLPSFHQTFHIDSSLFQIEVSFDIHKIKYSEFLDQQLNVEEDMTTAKSHLDTAIPDLVRELGYTFTSNTEQCRQNLLQLCGGPKVSAATVARIIGIMVRTHTGLDDPATLQNLNATGTSIWDKKDSNEPKTWNVEVFIKAVHELHPTLNWKEIIDELDHPGFAIKDRVGLIVLINALKLGFKVQGFQVIGIFTSKHWQFLY